MTALASRMALLTGRVPVCAVDDRELHQLPLFQLIFTVSLPSKETAGQLESAHITQVRSHRSGHAGQVTQVRSRLRSRSSVLGSKHPAAQLIYNGAQHTMEQGPTSFQCREE